MSRSILARHPDFRRLFMGNTVSLAGSSVTAVALPLTAVVYLHASAAEVGLLGAVPYVPKLLFGLPAGVWVDRLAYRRLLVLCDLTQVVLIGLVPILAAVGQLAIWQLYVVGSLAGLANLFETVTAQSFIPKLVSRQELLPANTALQLSMSSVATSGTALGGVLVSVLSAPFALVADAVSFAISGFVKARIRTAGLTAVGDRPTGELLGRQIVSGLRVVLGHRVIGRVTAAAAVGAFAGQVQGVLLVLFLVRVVHLSSGLVGVTVAMSGVAGMIGAMVATRITRRLGPGPTFILGMFTASLAGIVVAVTPDPVALALVVLAIAMLLRGAGPSLYGVNQRSLRQSLIAPEYLSRANSSWQFLVYGTQALGALVGGLLATVLGLRATFMFSSAIMLIGAATALLSPVRKLNTFTRSAADQEPPGDTRRAS